MLSLAEVLRRHWAQYERQFGAQILPSHRRAVQAILNCRTRALGGEVYRCADCRRDHFVYHSCNHRACPQCGHADATEWIEGQKLKLLPVPYYLITFTVPEGLRAWLRSHQKAGYGALLKESAGALQDVARRDKYLGAELVPTPLGHFLPAADRPGGSVSQPASSRPAGPAGGKADRRFGLAPKMGSRCTTGGQRRGGSEVPLSLCLSHGVGLAPDPRR